MKIEAAERKVWEIVHSVAARRCPARKTSRWVVNDNLRTHNCGTLLVCYGAPDVALHILCAHSGGKTNCENDQAKQRTKDNEAFTLMISSGQVNFHFKHPFEKGF